HHVQRQAVRVDPAPNVAAPGSEELYDHLLAAVDGGRRTRHRLRRILQRQTVVPSVGGDYIQGIADHIHGAFGDGGGDRRHPVRQLDGIVGLDDHRLRPAGCQHRVNPRPETADVLSGELARSPAGELLIRPGEAIRGTEPIELVDRQRLARVGHVVCEEGTQPGVPGLRIGCQPENAHAFATPCSTAADGALKENGRPKPPVNPEPAEAQKLRLKPATTPKPSLSVPPPAPPSASQSPWKAEARTSTPGPSV